MRDQFQLFHDYEIVTVACSVGALSYMILQQFEAAWGVALAHVAGIIVYVLSGTFRALLDKRYPTVETVAREEPRYRKAA